MGNSSKKSLSGQEPASPAQLSPAMRQYMAMKADHPDAILFFQMGDFYELFFDDAREAAPLLEITLTSRSKKGDEEIPMCGVPLSAGLEYANRLIGLGYTVAMAKQVGEPSKTKGIVDRAVWQIGTPGMPLTADSQPAREPHYLAAIFPAPGGIGLACFEVSTGEILLARFDGLESLRAEFAAVAPHECLIPEHCPLEIMNILKEQRIYPTRRPLASMDQEVAVSVFKALFGAHAVKCWELEKWPEALAAAGAVLDYAQSCYLADFRHMAPPRLLWQEEHLVMDEAAVANLEIFKTLRQGQLEGSLLGLLDRSATAMGGRLLRQWLARPLRDAPAICARHSAVENFLRDGLARDEIFSLMKKVSDLERTLGRIILGRGSPRDLAAIRDTLALIPAFKSCLSGLASDRLAILGEELPDLAEMVETLQGSLVKNPPFNAKDGGIISRGVSEELDELLDLEKGGKNAIAALEARERERTGISSLKVGFNRVYGYYLEVTRTNLQLAPPDWIRKQTIAGGERFLTSELKQWEEKILNAGERRLLLEEQILSELMAQVAAQARLIKESARILSEVDVLCALAATAEKYGWVRPELTEEDVIAITGGRHPVVEALMPPGEVFVANDVNLNPRERLMIITGPNMAGKSTILRQVALIIFLNQLGSFVPAEAARLSIRDRIFTRVGAADDLARGRSTFMVEMNETARILTMATPKSLVVLDEVGRGTSTYDGLSLAWAIAEYLHDLDGVGVPTLFATHYHELIKLAASKPRARNYNVAVKSVGGKVTFLRRLKEGGVNRSYGLAVAAMAGIPRKVLDRASEVMADFSQAGEHAIRPAVRQLSLFEALAVDIDKGPQYPEALKKLAAVNTEELTPLAALNLLNELSNEARELIETDN